MKTLHFFDDWALRLREGLDRKQGQPRRTGEIALGTHPELSIVRGAANPRFDERRGCYVSYVDCFEREGEGRFFLRVETDDPRHWPAPRWRVGSGPVWSRAENVVMDQHGRPLSCFNVLPLGGTPLADRGYFMNLYRYRSEDGQDSAATTFSPDGLHFDVDEKARWISHFSDTGNPVLYDCQAGQYRIYCRPEFVDRRVALVSSPDLESFGPATVILQPDAADPVCREFYGLDVMMYEDLFVGMLSVYDTEPTEIGRQKMEGTNQTHLAYSYNGQNWYRASREAFLPRTEAGTFFGGSVYTAVPVRTPDHCLLFHVMGNGVDHGVDGEDLPEDLLTEVATWKTFQYEMRLDGFSYLRTRARHGRIQTKSVVPDGGEVTINARTAPSGQVRVAVLDEKTLVPLPHYSLEDAVPITGDELFGKVCWREREDLSELQHRPVVLEVQVREGELYALRFVHQMAAAPQPGEDE